MRHSRATSANRIPWADYDQDYRKALEEETFREWREVGSRGKASNIRLLCDDLPRGAVLEVGCGTGVVARQLQADGFSKRYVVTDLSPVALADARRACGDSIGGAVAADARSIPFRSKAFDLAILSHVLEHLDLPEIAAREAGRIAARVLIEVPIENVLSNFIRHHLLRQPQIPNPAGHVQFWSHRSIRVFIERQCGLRILRSHIDLIRPEVDLWGKKGVWLVRARFKGFLKRVLPTSLYRRLLTTHITLLCQENP
jgi:SAM-dependent methyltransferase